MIKEIKDDKSVNNVRIIRGHKCRWNKLVQIDSYWFKNRNLMNDTHLLLSWDIKLKVLKKRYFALKILSLVKISIGVRALDSHIRIQS